MKITTRLRVCLNALLRPLNLHIETLVAKNQEMARFQALRAAERFSRPVFALPLLALDNACRSTVDIVGKYQRELARLDRPEENDVQFLADNAYFSSPDTDVLYSFVREIQPEKFIEIGSGNSTRLVRQAIIDGNLNTRLISIDPQPRIDVAGFADEVRTVRVEQLNATMLADELTAGDVLFIDSSHELLTGNDVVYEFLELIPLLRSGIYVHVHDVSLPFDYPWSWLETSDGMQQWGEQYLLQAILSSGDHFEVLWAGYHCQQTSNDQFRRWFPRSGFRDARSFWIRRR